MSSPVGPSEAVQIAIDLLVLLVYGRNVVDFDSDFDSDVVASRVVVRASWRARAKPASPHGRARHAGVQT